MRNSLNVILPFAGITQYIDAALSGDNDDLRNLWLKYAINPYWDEWAAGQFNEQRVRQELSNPFTDIDKLKKSIDIIEASGIEKLLQQKYALISELLPSQEEKKAVCIYPNPYLDQSVHGVVGSCVGDNVLIQINPTIPGWEEFLPWVLAHEHNHSVWGYNYYYLMGNSSQDVLASIISEGQADSFAKAVCPGLNPNWIHALTPGQEKQQWTAIQEYLRFEDNIELHIRFFFGDTKTGTPPFTGYTLGFKIVQEFLKKRPEVSFDKLVGFDPSDILEISGYDGEAKLQ